MATKADAPALLDVFTRHQVYLEGLKAGQGPIFDAVMQQLRRDLRAIFFDIDFDQLSEMTKRQLDLFVRQLRSAQLQHFNTYTQQVLNDLKQFAALDTRMTADIMEETQEQADVKKHRKAIAALTAAAGIDRLWAFIRNAPTPATGMTPEDFVKQFAVGAGDALEFAVRKGYANKMKTGDVLRLLTGTPRLNYRDGLLTRFSNQARGMTATLLQHAAGIVQAAVASQYFEKYRWVSILDSHTSAICQSRAGKIYVYGQGPLPPAHPLCRSHTEPYDGSDDGNIGTYYSWLKKQPAKVQDDIIGKAKAARLREGALKSDEVPQFSDVSPLTLAQFKDKLGLILAT